MVTARTIESMGVTLFDKGTGIKSSIGWQLLNMTSYNCRDFTVLHFNHLSVVTMQHFAPPGTDSQEVGIVAGHSRVTRISVHGSAHQLLQVPVPARNWTSIPMQLDDNKVPFNKLFECQYMYSQSNAKHSCFQHIFLNYFPPTAFQVIFSLHNP